MSIIYCFMDKAIYNTPIFSVMFIEKEEKNMVIYIYVQISTEKGGTKNMQLLIPRTPRM